MDERAVFERFHEALDDIEPRAGTYERFRATFTNPPAAAKRRPVFQLRFTKMSLRFVAIAAAVAVAITLVAGYLATHKQPPTGSIPAHPDANLLAYQQVIASDYQQMNDAQSQHCGTIQDEGCAAAIARLNPVLQKWVDDLGRLRTPAHYVVLDAMLRAHLRAAVADFDAAVIFQQQHNQAGFDLAMGDVLYERGWLDPTSFLLEGTNQSDSNSYKEAVTLATQTLNSCIQAGGRCQVLAGGEPCPVDRTLKCNNDIQSAETSVQIVVLALVQNPPSSASAAGQVNTTQNALLSTDSAVLAIAAAQLHGDSAGVSAAESAFATSFQVALRDVEALPPA